MAVALFFLGHWYSSIFSQSFFNHRYAAHQQFSMSKFWERFFYIFSFISMGSSYLSAHVYAIMHRMHHAYADTEKDVHSPVIDENLFKMMWRTRRIYLDIYAQKMNIDPQFFKNLPQWNWFDRMANFRMTRIAWALFYIAFYYFFAEAWYWWLLLPTHFIMGPLHGVIVNWYSHKYGHRNFKVNDTSTNLLPFDFLLMGELYHNNHHARPNSADFGYKWYELDMMYPLIKLMDGIGILKLNKRN